MAPDDNGAPVIPSVGIALPVDQGCRVSELRALAAEVEDAGFDVVSVGEVAGVELFATLAAVATATTRLRILAAVAPIVARSPALAAMGIATVADLAGDRLSFGVGASSPTVAGWHGRPRGTPVTDVARYVSELRTAFRGDALESSSGPRFRLQQPPARVPLLVAAIGPRLLDVAGHVGDGALLSLCPSAELPGRLAHVEAGRAAAGRMLEPYEFVSTAIPVSIGGADDELRIRRYLLPYAMASSHRPGFARAVPAIDAVAEHWERNDRAGALDRFDEGVVESFGATSAAAAVERCVGDGRAGIDTVVLNPVCDTAGDLRSVRRAVAAVGHQLARTRRARFAERSAAR